MQLTHPSVFGGYAKELTLSDPDLNISLGVTLMGKLRRSVGYDLPKLASGYNAGLAGGGVPHHSASSPWGIRETRGHIERCVRASNTAVRILKEPLVKETEEEIRAKVVEIALGELGPGRVPEYWRICGIDPAPKPGEKGGEWCGAFALWALKRAGLATRVNWTIGLGFAEVQGLRRTRSPRPGDIAYDDKPYQHHAIVESLVDGILTTIDGNQPDVRRKVRKLPADFTFYSIDKFLAAAGTADTDPQIEAVQPTLREGSTQRGAVRTVQDIVGALVDGIFGPKTRGRVEAFQRGHGLVADGIVGPKTWAAIMVAQQRERGE